MQKPKKTHLYLGILFFSGAILLSNPLSTDASEVTIEGYVQGGTGIELQGAFSSGIIFEQVEYPFEDITTSWLANNEVDSISFVDDSSDPGFHITVSVSDLTYTGDSLTQGSIAAENIKFIGTTDDTSVVAPTIGYDNNEYTLNVLPDSCSAATPDKFTFGSALTDSNSNYTLDGNPAPQTLLSSSSTCLTVGNINLDKISLTYPAGTHVGSYSSTILFTMTDGQTP